MRDRRTASSRRAPKHVDRETVDTMEQVEALIASNDLEQAQALLEQNRGVAESDVRWHFLHGVLLERQGNGEAAMAAFERSLELEEGHTEALFRLAYNLDLRGQDDEAIQLYERCVQNSPAHVNALVNLAVLYEDRGEYEQAAECLAAVLVNHPNHARARLFLKDVESSMDMFYDEDQERTQVKHNAVLDIPISDFELSVRSRNCLRKMNINTLGDLLRITEAELLSYKNFGETSLNEIKAMLSQKGLRLGQAIEQATVTPGTSPRRPMPQNIPLEVLNKPVSELELSVRSRKCLQRLNIVTLADLASRTEAELLNTKNFGQTSLNEIKQRLTQHGLSLRRVDDADA
jgi:DNA-directed RNA polymerase subunit alpha